MTLFHFRPNHLEHIKLISIKKYAKSEVAVAEKKCKENLKSDKSEKQVLRRTDFLDSLYSCLPKSAVISIPISYGDRSKDMHAVMLKRLLAIADDNDVSSSTVVNIFKFIGQNCETWVSFKLLNSLCSSHASTASNRITTEKFDTF